MTTKPAKYKMLPYNRQGEIDYASLDFDPNEKELPPDPWNRTAKSTKSSAF